MEGTATLNPSITFDKMRRLSSILSRATQKKTHHINQGLFTFDFPSSTFLSFKQHYAHFSTRRNLLEVETISEEFIKPATPTPEHLRVYEVSLFDQFFINNFIPFIYFYPNHLENESHNDLFVKRRQILKQSLSETLTRFYPVAGRVMDTRYIDCNDDGVYYVETKVHDRFSDFLKQPDNKSIHRLLPLHPNSEELHSKKCLAMVQVNEFSCGGIAIGVYTSHKILDGYSLATFFRAWAATARNSPNEICPSFIAPSIFPSDPAGPKNPTILPGCAPNKSQTKRFVFAASSLETLKKKADSSRVIAVMALVWKCTMAASKAQSTTTTHPEYFSLGTVVNLRERSLSPIPPYCIGNIIWNTNPIQCSAGEDLGLCSIAQLVKNNTNKINGDILEKMKRDGFALKVDELLKKLKMFYTERVNFKHTFVSSICNNGMYESDFGWGKPIWISFGLADTRNFLTENAVVLMDTRSGQGIEAWVTLNEEDMAIFERNPELLDLASVNPTPLQPFE